MKSLENRYYDKHLSELMFFNLEQKGLRGDLIVLCNYLKEGCSKVGISVFS